MPLWLVEVVVWSFRLRFELGQTTGLQYEGEEWVVRDKVGERVVLAPADQASTISAARSLALVGRGYDGEDQASDAGLRWRDYLTLALAQINVGVDFGDRTGWGGVLTERAAADFASGAPVMRDAHGLMVYEVDARPIFVRAGKLGRRKSGPPEWLISALGNSIERGVRLNDRQRLAYDLYSASFSESNSDTRFLMLMMALETLIQPRALEDSVQRLVDNMARLVEESGISRFEAESMYGKLKWFRVESVNRAGKRLAAQLAGRMYMDEVPEKFFKCCYGLRSSLVHGDMPRPSGAILSIRAEALEHFVADLICAMASGGHKVSEGW